MMTADPANEVAQSEPIQTDPMLDQADDAGDEPEPTPVRVVPGRGRGGRR